MRGRDEPIYLAVFCAWMCHGQSEQNAPGSDFERQSTKRGFYLIPRYRACHGALRWYAACHDYETGRAPFLDRAGTPIKRGIAEAIVTEGDGKEVHLAL